MQIFTKEEIAQRACNSWASHMDETIIDECVNELIDYPNFKFISEIRRFVGLNIHSFGPGIYIVKY